MDNQGVLNLLDNVFIICSALSVTFVIVSVILLFALRIRDVFYELSGKARAEATKKMQENYAVTGSLRQGDGPAATSETSGKLASNSSGLYLTSGLSVSAEKGGTDGTTVLDRKQTGLKRDESRKESPGGQNNLFNVNKEVILVHTEEKIS